MKIKATKAQAQQQADGHASNQDDQYLFVRRYEEVDADFFTIETDRWAFDSFDELRATIDELEKAIGNN